MRAEDFRRKAGSVISGYNVVLSNELIDPEYEVELETNSAATTPAGHLIVARIKPIAPSELPVFDLRWDHGRNVLDVDLVGDDRQRELFKAEKQGYEGHQTEEVTKEPRVFRVDIRIPHRQIYKALITLNVTRAIDFHAQRQPISADASRIKIVPGQRSGQPSIRGLRVTVWDVMDMRASGMSEDEILEDYPYLERDDFPAIYAYASQFPREPAAH